MKSWPTKPLEEVCVINPKLAASEVPLADREVTFVPMAAVDEISGNIARPELRKYSQVAKGYTPFRENDVLFAKITPCMENGKATIARGLMNRVGFGSTEFHVLRPTSAVLPEWVFAFIRQPAFRSEAQSNFTGTAGQRRVPLEFMKRVQIPVPPLVEQERIVKLLNEADALRKLRNDADRRTAALIPALFHEMFGIPLGDSLSYPVRKMGELIRDGDKINYGVVQPGDGVSDGIPIVRAGDFNGMSIDKEHLKRISPEIEEKYSRSRLRGDEILISCVGSIGYVALADSSLAGFNIVRAVARVPLRDEIDRIFVASQLMTPELQNFFRKETRTVAQPTLNIKQIQEAPIILPPLELQKEFGARVTEIRALEAEQAFSRNRIEALFQAMLHGAFAGEI